MHQLRSASTPLSTILGPGEDPAPTLPGHLPTARRRRAGGWAGRGPSGPTGAPAVPRTRARGVIGVSVLVGLFAGTLVLAACSGDLGDAAGADAVVHPEVEERYRIGSVEGGRWDSFSRIASVRFDDAGRLYLLDADERRVTVVDPDGSFAAGFGERGEGPGQFRLPVGLAVLPTGEIAVADGGHRGLLLFSVDGTYLRSVPFPQGTAPANLLFPHGDDGLVFASRGIVMSSAGGGPPQMPTDIPIHRLLLEGGDEGISDPIHRAWRPTREMSARGGPGGGPAGMMAFGGPRAFEPQLHLAVLPDGRIAVADSSSYRIRMLDPDGSEAGLVERPVAPQPVGEREQELERERRLRDLAEGRGPQVQVVTSGPGGTQTMGTNDLREVLEEQIRNIEFWPEIPVIERLAADFEGRLWVQRSGGVEEPGPIDVLDADGRLLATIPAGEIAFPSAFGPDGLVAWVERDELDIEGIRVARLVGIP
jgi:hypothetical protein